MESAASAPLSSSCSPPLSAEALNDVRDRLKGPPLTGRRVLIPLGSKAFLPGVLYPELKQYETSPSSVASSLDQEETYKEKECVTVRQVAKPDDATVSEEVMTRQEALIYLQQEIQQQTRRNEKPSPKASSSGPSKTSDTKPTSQPAVALPFVEIREEIDAVGNETKAEALNVTEQLKRLQGGSSDETDGHSDMLAAPRNNDLDENFEPISDDFNDVPRTVSDEEYAKLSNRLEQLILLEEQAQKPASHVSKQKLGWSKGFLNAAPKPKNAPPRSARCSTPKTTDIIVKHAAEPPELDPLRHTTSSPAKPSNEPSKGVSFHPHESVQEIPRIGERSVREIASSRSPGKSSTDAFSSPKVIEKSSPTRKQKHRNTAVASHAAPASVEAVATKRISRFAQERLQQRQGHFN
jgi:hypothetical protein